MSKNLSEQEQVRRNSMDELRKMGIDPYPAQLFEVNVTAKGILENYEKRKLDYKKTAHSTNLHFCSSD